MTDTKNISAPLVSVIIPSYNHAGYIEEAVLSVINQSYENIELIIIDDGSKDESPELLKKLQKQYNFFLLCRENKGLSVTLNEAIREYSHGEYVSILASDDYWIREKIKTQADYLNKNKEYALVFGKSYPVNSSGDILENISVVDPVKELTFETLIENNCIPATTVMFQRKVWEKCGGFKEGSYIEDWDLWLKIIYHYKIAYLNQHFTYYRMHDTNISSNILKLYTCMDEIVQSWEDKIDPVLFKKISARRKSITFNVLARKYKKKSLCYLNLFSSYWDKFIIINYTKGLLKLFFIW